MEAAEGMEAVTLAAKEKPISPDDIGKKVSVYDLPEGATVRWEPSTVLITIGRPHPNGGRYVREEGSSMDGCLANSIVVRLVSLPDAESEGGAIFKARIAVVEAMGACHGVLAGSDVGDKLDALIAAARADGVTSLEAATLRMAATDDDLETVLGPLKELNAKLKEKLHRGSFTPFQCHECGGRVDLRENTGYSEGYASGRMTVSPTLKLPKCNGCGDVYLDPHFERAVHASNVETLLKAAVIARAYMLTYRCREHVTPPLEGVCDACIAETFALAAMADAIGSVLGPDDDVAHLVPT